MDFYDKTIGIVGLGYLGLPLAVEFSRLRPAIEFDIDPQPIVQLAQGRDSTLVVEADELAQARLLT